MIRIAYYLILLLITLTRASGTALPDARKPLIIEPSDKTLFLFGNYDYRRFASLFSATPFHQLITSQTGLSAGNALIQTPVSDLEVYQALIELGAIAGDNLTPDTWHQRNDPDHPDPDLHASGTSLDISVSFDAGHSFTGLNGMMAFAEEIKPEFVFAGNKKWIPVFRSGCVVCLQSCPGSKIANASRTIRDYQKNKKQFDLLPLYKKYRGPVIIRINISPGN